MKVPGRPYTDPYVAGVGLGLALLAAFIFAGQGIGASGAFSSAIAGAVSLAVGPQRAAANAAVSPYLVQGMVRPLRDWLLLEVAGVIVGGFASAKFAGRLKVGMDRGRNLSQTSRVWAALGGGALMGLGAKLARGCTSGLALTGGAQLSVGGWVFIVTCFAAAYLLSPLVRRLWL